MMPRTPKGEPIEVLINPLSVFSRMNVGQIHELALGRVLDEAKVKLNAILGNGRKDIENFIISIYAALDPTADKSYASSIAKSLKSMSTEIFSRSIKALAANGLRYIAAPFQSPNTKNLIAVCKVLNIKLEEKLFLPEFNSYTREPVFHGIMYMEKLEHIAENKQTVREIGPYIKTTMEPTRGKAQSGGQRFGELDTWGLFAYDSKNTVKDFWLINGDNPEIKKEVISNIQQYGEVNVEDINNKVNTGGSRTMMENMFMGMGINPNAA
jgi:DNA-directed RNA polymerase subunit beta